MKIQFPIQLEDITIILKRGECYGLCPAYDLEVSGSGEVRFTGYMFVKCKGEHREKISPKSVFRIFKQALEIGFFKMENNYFNGPDYELDKDNKIQAVPVTWTDMPSYEVSIKIKDKVKTVVDYYGAPKRLRRFEDLIDRVCRSERWVGKPEERGE